MATVIEYYTVLQEDDGFSVGYSAPYAIAHFLSLSAAEELAKRNRFWRVSDRKSMTIHDSVEQYDEFKSQAAKAAALAKLTAEERAILGLV